jgi:exodeoxyribonuclease VIII
MDEKDAEIGIHEGVPFDRYQQWGAVTGGFLWTLKEQSPAHAVAERDAEREPTPAMIFGAAFHTAMLEPDDLERRYVAKPEGMSFATKEGKLWRLQQTKEIITAKEWDALRGMQDSLFAHPFAGAIMREQGMKEVSVLWEDQTGYGKSRGLDPVRCQGRPDFLPDGRLIDLKTALDARPHAFARQADSMGYWMKMAWYQEGLELAGAKRPQEVMLIAIEKEPPYAVNVFLLPTETLNCGKAYKEAALFTYRTCLLDGVWPAYEETIHPITLPPWRITAIYG